MQTPDQIRAMYRTLGEQMQTQDGTRLCLLNTADRTAFDTTTVGDYTLRYLTADADLGEGDTVTISGTAYEVVTLAERINAHESVVQLMRAA